MTNVYTYDYSKLNGVIIEKFGSVSNFAKEMNLSVQSVSMKLNNRRKFTTDEIMKAKEILNLKRVDDYFFMVNI